MTNVERLRRRRADLLRAARAYSSAITRCEVAETESYAVERAAVSYARAAAACEVPSRRGGVAEASVIAWLAYNTPGLSLDNENDRVMLAGLLVANGFAPKS